jgi:positive regulator of sigma E activity
MITWVVLSSAFLVHLFSMMFPGWLFAFMWDTGTYFQIEYWVVVLTVLCANTVIVVEVYKFVQRKEIEPSTMMLVNLFPITAGLVVGSALIY